MDDRDINYVPVEVVAPDPAWTMEFRRRAEGLQRVLGDVARRVDHIGSTAVPGLDAKPTIDIQVSVDDIEHVAGFRSAMEPLGYTFHGRSLGDEDHRFFSAPARAVHVHICRTGSTMERNHLLFRDYLRAHPKVAREYAQLKYQLAREHPLDRVAFNEAKTEFIGQVMAQAEHWAQDIDWSVGSAAVDDAFVPDVVRAAEARAADAGFTLSCEPGVGRFLATLAAAVPLRGRILEIGTGAGVGTAWIVYGLGARTDVEVITVEINRATAALAQRGEWPGFVTMRQEDVLAIFDQLGTFDLIFADAPGGKWEGLDRTIAALGQGGMLLVDDMTPQEHWSEFQRVKQDEVRRTLLGHPELVAQELTAASGMILAVRR